MKKELTETILEDIRSRQSSLKDLILITDQQAMSLLQLYVTISAGAASIAVAGLSALTPLPLTITVSLITVTAMLLAGSTACIRTMKSTKVALPGRDADFWRWAMHPNIDEGDVAEEYLSSAGTSFTHNIELNKKTSGLLMTAKRLGVWTPVVALISGAATALLIYVGAV